MFRLLSQLVRFTIVGAIGAAVDFGGYVSLTRTLPPLQRHYVATSLMTAFLATLVGYFLNRRWTFRHPERSLQQYRRYVSVYAASILWQNVLLAAGVQWLDLYDVLAKALAVIVVAFGWNFLLVKFWVFRDGRPVTAPS